MLTTGNDWKYLFKLDWTRLCTYLLDGILPAISPKPYGMRRTLYAQNLYRIFHTSKEKYSRQAKWHLSEFNILWFYSLLIFFPLKCLAIQVSDSRIFCMFKPLVNPLAVFGWHNFQEPCVVVQACFRLMEWDLFALSSLTLVRWLNIFRKKS